ncbi:MAG: DUF2066 domain-containing protein [Hyphomicrobium sp.]|nr:DUF2066 domain-containing protein [Hyphomicrobium sp.]
MGRTARLSAAEEHPVPKKLPRWKSGHGRRSAAVFAAVVGLLPSATLAAGGQVFTVGNYPVEAKAANAVAAKEQAISSGQAAAFRSLLKRLVPVTAYAGLERIRGTDASTMLDGFAVRSERNSSTAYIASLDFSFQPDAVRSLLTGAGIPFVERQAPVTVVVPVSRDGSSASAAYRPASGTWAAVWPDLDIDNSLTPLKIEVLKPDVQPATLGSLYENDTGAVATLASQYRADRIVFAIADVDKSAGRVNVLLAGADAVGPFSWTKSYRLTDGDVAYTLELAAVISHGVLEGRWKAAQAPGSVAAAPGGYGGGIMAPYDPYATVPGGNQFAAPGNDIAFEARYAGNGEWNEIRRRLLDTPGVDDIRISNLSGSSASIVVKYPGDGQALAAAMARQGLSLLNEGGVFVVKTARW